MSRSTPINTAARWLFLASLFGTTGTAQVPQAPPPPVVESRPDSEIPPEPLSRLGPLAGETAYSIGDPSDEEQMYLEFVNYVRANPAGEANRWATTTNPDILSAYDYFDVDLAKFVADTSLYPVVAPLAFEPRLTQAARGHSQWMLTTGVQAHNETNPANTPGDRITAQGYPWQTYGESIYAYAESADHGFAGFEVDWGFGPGGMQSPPGHRNSNHQPAFREAGVGVIRANGANNTGPSAVTIDFGARQNPVPMVTGVAFYDLNSNGRYDMGEGLGGITVNVNESGYFATTSPSGGYAIPTANAARVVTFSAPNLATQTFNRTIAGGSNIKVDLILPYVAPSVTGPAHIPSGQATSFTITPVAGATGYRWRRATLSSTPPSFDASSGLQGVLVNAPGTPNPLVSRNGGQAYHLTHTLDETVAIMEFNVSLRPKAQGAVQFLSRLGWATSKQVAQLEVSADDGASWVSIWSQAGAGNAGETLYNPRTVSLAAYAGKVVRLRFNYVVCSGCSLFPQGEDGVGFHVDDVTFQNTEQITFGTPVDIGPSTQFSFTPPANGTYELSAQPLKARGSLPYGSAMVVDTANVVPPTVTVVSPIVGPNGKVRVDFSVAGTLSGTPTLLGSPTLSGSYVPVAATLKTNSATSFSFQVEPTADRSFMKVSVP